MAYSNYTYQPTYTGSPDLYKQREMQYYPQSYMQSFPVPTTEPTISCRPVASIDEAKAIPIDFSGNLMVFPDISHGMIYTKQLNVSDGSAIFKIYSLTQPQEQNIQTIEQPEYVLKSDFDKLKSDFESLLNQLSPTQPIGKRGTKNSNE